MPLARRAPLRAALEARLGDVTRLRSHRPVVVDALETSAGDSEETLRVLMVRTLPSAAGGESGALSKAIEDVQRLDVAEDRWLRLIDAWSCVFELALRHRSAVAGPAFEALLAGYENALRTTLDRLAQ